VAQKRLGTAGIGYSSIVSVLPRVTHMAVGKLPLVKQTNDVKLHFWSSLALKRATVVASVACLKHNSDAKVKGVKIFKI